MERSNMWNLCWPPVDLACQLSSETLKEMVDRPDTFLRGESPNEVVICVRFQVIRVRTLP